jgi:hypothetical protein
MIFESGSGRVLSDAEVDMLDLWEIAGLGIRMRNRKSSRNSVM